MRSTAATFNLWFRIPLLFLLFAWALPWFTADTALAFTLADGIFSALLLTVGSMVAGLIFVVIAVAGFNLLGVSREKRGEMKGLGFALSFLFMSFAFWGGAILFPTVYSVTLLGALFASFVFNLILAVTLPGRSGTGTGGSTGPGKTK